MSKLPLLEIKDLRVSFPLEEGMVQAVAGVNLKIFPGQVVGVVGESGCGKTVTAQSILRIIPPPGRIDSGQILFRAPGQTENGAGDHVVDIARLDSKDEALRQIRGNDIAMIFQEPMSAFSPVHTIGSQIMEAILLHQPVTEKEARDKTVELLRLVGISNAEERVDNYPHQFSGGMRQRAMIAMALSCNPSLLIADEPTTALDVTIQAQILDLLRRLQQQFGMAVMFITHNLGVIAQTADHIAIMYLGQVVEEGPVREILRNPKHPYTMDLLRAVPRLGKTAGQRLVAIKGTIPSPFQRPTGCPFHPRCSRMIQGVCNTHIPQLVQLNEIHSVRCVLYEPQAPQPNPEPADVRAAPTAA
jgi:peptide/nickel transport system ATP-binding protein